ncbi:MAG: class A beta-lactamase [Legionellales bacterium]|nr:class A beta-lactamase [Legionellales bacterium]
MLQFLKRHCFLIVMMTIFFCVSVFANTPVITLTATQKKFERLEKRLDGKIGVYAIDTNTNHIVAYRENEYFPVQSTAKLMVVAALLKHSEKFKNLLDQKVIYSANDLMAFSPVSKKYLKQGLSLQALAAAAMIYSDNTAANLITKKLGGPKEVTAFAHAIGNLSFDMAHYEGSLNSNPNHHEDAATPKDMALTLQKLTLGDVLTVHLRTQLMAWMRNNTTSYRRIRQATPLGWNVADKTGSGSYGVANDLGILWSPLCKPIVLAIYTVRNHHDEKYRDDIVASITHFVLNEFSKQDLCFQENATA